MQQLTFAEISAMKGNGSSMRFVLKHFIDKGAEVYLLHEDTVPAVKRFFIVKYDGLVIPLRAYKLNFYCVYNSALAQSFTSDKLGSQNLLEAFNIPTPRTITYSQDTDVADFIAQVSSVVVKPRNGAHGDGIAVNLSSVEEAEKAISVAQAVDNRVLLQQYVSGADHRLLFIDYTFVAAVRREPASIVGDGKRSVKEIVEAQNEEKYRLWQAIREGAENADGIKGSISPTPIDEIIAARGAAFLNLTPEHGEQVQLIDKANVSLGGQTVDVTDQINPELTEQLSTLLRNIGLPLCGIDVLSTDISSTPEAGKSFVIELNAAPGLRLHELPNSGQARPVCGMIADSLIAYYRNLQTTVT